MYEDYPPIVWAPCKSTHSDLDASCAYIKVPTFYKEIECTKESATDNDGDQQPCIGKEIRADDTDIIIGGDAANSASAGFSLQDRTDKSLMGKDQQDYLQYQDTQAEKLKADREKAFACVKEAKKVLNDEERKELCEDAPPKAPSDPRTIYSVYSQCSTSTATAHITPCLANPPVTAYTSCGCPYHVTYASKETEPLPEIACSCETVSAPRLATVTQCTTPVDPDFIRRYVHSYLRTHPHKHNILKLANAIEKRRIEGYNFWDPKSLRLFVKKYVKGHPKKAIFLIGGGPGKADWHLDCLIKQYVCWLKNNFVLYVVHPRGVGNSARVPSGVNVWESFKNPDVFISEFYHPFYAFTVTNSAMDVYNVFQREKLDTHYAQMKWYIHACSYGTLVAQRMMVIKPDELDGVILDGVISPNPNVNRNIEDYGHRNNEILKNCMRSAYCRKQIKSVDNFMSIWRRAEKGSTRCGRFLKQMFPNDQEYIRFIRSVMDYYFSRNEVVGVQFAYALGKCPNYSFFKKFVQDNLICWMSYARCEPTDLHPMIYAIVTQSEVVGKRMLIHDIKYKALKDVTCHCDLIRGSRKSFAKYNYLLDPWAHQYAFNKKTPVLLMHGRMDGCTPVENAIDVFLHGNQHLSKIMIFENEGHTVSCSGSPCLDTLIKEFYLVPMSLDVLPADECLRILNTGTLNWEGFYGNLWNGWDWIWCLLFWLLVLLLLLLLGFFLYRRFRRGGSGSNA